MNAPARTPLHESYFQFPLCAWAFGKTPEERIGAIISFGIVEAGRAIWRRSSQEQRSAWLSSLGISRTLPDGFNDRNQVHLATLFAAEKMGMTIYNIPATLSRHSALNAFRSAFESLHKNDAIVRLRKDFVLEARDGKRITARELAVLGAIYSVIGDKSYPVRITRQTIRYRALGYRTVAIAQAELPCREDGAKLLSEWELRKTLDSLTARKFFCRRTIGRRQTYYSHRMRDSEFELALFDLKTRRIVSRQMQSDKNRALTERIRKAHRSSGPENR